MIYLAHYELRNRKNQKIVEKQGIMSAGNPTEAIQKVLNLVGLEPLSSSKEITILKDESLYYREGTNGLHKIHVCNLDKMMTLKEKSF
jgi:hypothetical protein